MSKELSKTEIEFYNNTLTAVEKDGQLFVAIKPICEAIGIDFEAQRQLINRDEVLCSVACMIKATGQDGKQYEMVTLPLDFLNGWLFKIDISRLKIDKSKKDTLIKYQKECYKVLNNYWTKGISINPRLNLEIKSIELLSESVANLTKLIETF
jgi:hypothetical protein